MPLPLIIAANSAVGKSWAHLAIAILAGFTAGGTFLFGVFDLTAPGNELRNPTGVDIGIMITGVAAATLASKPVRERLARYMPLDPDNPVHSLALVLAAILLGVQIATVAFGNVLTQDQKLPPLDIDDMAAQELPVLVIAFAGVGLYVRRTLTTSSERLGVVTPAWWHIALALAAAGAFYEVSQASGWLGQTVTPEMASQVNKAVTHLFGALVSQPLGIAALSLLPGICEEVLFRGALQPRFGLLATAILFTAIHTEYGLSFDIVTIFVLAIGLGFIRKYANTTACIATHTAFNLLGSFDIPGTAQVAIALITVVLIAVTVFEVRRRKVLVAAEEAVR